MGGSEGGGCQPQLSAVIPLSSGAAPNPRAGEGELGQVPPSGRGLWGPPRLGHFPVLPLSEGEEGAEEGGGGGSQGGTVGLSPSLSPGRCGAVGR